MCFSFLTDNVVLAYCFHRPFTCKLIREFEAKCYKVGLCMRKYIQASTA